MAELRAPPLDLGSKNQRFLEGLDVKLISHPSMSQLFEADTHVLDIEDAPDADADSGDLALTDCFTQEDLKGAISLFNDIPRLQDDQLRGILRI